LFATKSYVLLFHCVFKGSECSGEINRQDQEWRGHRLSTNALRAAKRHGWGKTRVGQEAASLRAGLPFGADLLVDNRLLLH